VCTPDGGVFLEDSRAGISERNDINMSTLKTYLAEKYMSGPKADVILSKTAPQKKKKRKAKETSGDGMMIRDEDGGWGDATKEDEDDIADAVVETDRGFKKRKVVGSSTETNWITVSQNIVDTTSNMTEEEIALAQETVYRDSSGKKIDTKAAKAEAARMKREREEKEAKKMEWGKGLVQKDEAAKRREALEKQKDTTFARYADDKDLNEELKARELWNDPAAAFMTVGVSFSSGNLLLTCVLFRKRKTRVLGNQSIRDLLLLLTDLV
jgi:pre-mRNA-splicing factor CWC26